MLGVVTHWLLVSQQPDGHVVGLQPTTTSAEPPPSTETSFELSMPGPGSFDVSLGAASTFTIPPSAAELSPASPDFTSIELSVETSARVASIVSRVGPSKGASTRVSSLRASDGPDVPLSGSVSDLMSLDPRPSAAFRCSNVPARSPGASSAPASLGWHVAVSAQVGSKPHPFVLVPMPSASQAKANVGTRPGPDSKAGAPDSMRVGRRFVFI
jgi:hypothetical protein